jgi:hypothetical protein
MPRRGHLVLLGAASVIAVRSLQGFQLDVLAVTSLSVTITITCRFG